MTIEKDFFRQVMGHFATGVTVATTSNEGVPGGLTVNAFCSVSLNPPLVLICVDLHSGALASIRESGIFAVNMLTEQQEDLSRCFATQNKDRFEHFCSASYRTVATGAPVLTDVLAFVDARVVAEYPGGDHSIFLGQVEALGIGDTTLFTTEGVQEHYENSANGHTIIKNEAPLLYYLGNYRHLTEASPALNASVPSSTSHQRASEGNA